MTTAVQHRRGSTSEHSTFTGLVGEVTIDTTKDTAVIHDGSLAGGYPLAKENLSNVTPTGLPTIDGASTASDDKFFIYDQSASVLKSITRAELNNAIEQDALANVAITGGTINGTSVGATTPSTGAFTTLSSSSTTILNGTTIPASKTLVTLDNTQTLTNKTLTSPVISGGSIDNAAIGATTAAGGAFTTLTTSGAVTHNGGTANGVAYLNGSKVLTTGSALTFDGTNFVLGANKVIVKNAVGDVQGLQIYQAASDVSSIFNYYNGALAFGVNNAEQMRLTSTGLGIGTSSPAVKLHVNAGSAGVQALFSYGTGTPTIAIGNSTTTYNTQIGYNVNSEYGYIQAVAAAGVYDDIAINPNGGNVGIGTSSPATRLSVDNTRSDTAGTGWFTYTNAAVTSGKRGMRVDTNNVYWFDYYNGASWSAQMGLDSSGNLGLGVTPSAWASTHKALQMNWSAFSTDAGNGETSVSTNAFASAASTWNYRSTAPASRYTQDYYGKHIWYTAPSGTAGNAISFTQALTLTAAGQLLVGQTSSPLGSKFAMTFSGSTENGMDITDSTNTTGTFYAGFRNSSGGACGSISRAAGNTVLYNTTSDQRLKENIQDSGSASYLIDAIQVRKYDWKVDGSHQRYGFIAQELVTVVPEAVHQPTDPEEMMAVDYSKLVPMLVKEIQDMRVRLSALEAK